MAGIAEVETSFKKNFKQKLKEFCLYINLCNSCTKKLQIFKDHLRHLGLKNMPHPEVIDLQNIRHFKCNATMYFFFKIKKTAVC